MRRTLLGALLCSASIVGVSAGSAFAGEVTGQDPQRGTPILSHNEDEWDDVGKFTVLASACSYSGLEDESGGRVQSFGVFGPASEDGATVSQVYAKTGLIRAIGPGTECKGSGGGAQK